MLGNALEIIGCAIAAGGTIVTCYKIKKNSESKDKCPVHTTMVERLNRGDKQFKEICDGIQIIKGIVLALAVKAEIAPDSYKDLVK